jgi:hypothetical protein
MIARCAHDLKSHRICPSVFQRVVNFHPLPYSAPFGLVVDCRCARIYVTRYDTRRMQGNPYDAHQNAIFLRVYARSSG